MNTDYKQKRRKKTVIYIDFSGFRISHFAKLRILRDPDGNSLLQILSDGEPVMAFLFRNFSEQTLTWKRDMIARQVCPLPQYPISSEEAVSMIPVVAVPALPELEMWVARTTFGEDMFWCCRELLLNVYPSGNGSCIDLTKSLMQNFAYFRIPARQPDHEEVLNKVFLLREVCHNNRQARIESYLGQQKVCWYIPTAI